MVDTSSMPQDELDLWSDINNPNNDADMDDWADAHNPKTTCLLTIFNLWSCISDNDMATVATHCCLSFLTDLGDYFEVSTGNAKLSPVNIAEDVS